MSHMSYTVTNSHTFTITNARHLSSKVAADMHLCSQYYGKPSEQHIREYAEELAQYLNEGYVAKYEFGYKKDEVRVVSWRYEIDAAGSITTDDRAGKVVAYVDVAGATFYNFLTQSSAFFKLSVEDQARFEAGLPIRRSAGTLPADGRGVWTSDRNYYSGGRGLGRQTFQPL